MNQKAISTVAIAIIAIVIVAIGVGVYFLTRPGPNSTTTTTTTTTLPATTSTTTQPGTTTTTQPSGTSTSTTTATTTTIATTTSTTTTTTMPGETPPPSPTPTPTPPSPFTTLEVGRYARYNATTYQDGEPSSWNLYVISVSSEDDTKGAPAWVLNMTTVSQETPGMRTIVLLWFAKSDYTAIYYNMTAYLDGAVLYTYEGSYLVSPTPGGTAPPGTPVPYSGWSTITTEDVEICGTMYQGAIKIQTTVGTTVSTAWVHSSVPVWGIVKLEERDNGQLTYTQLLMEHN